MFNDQFITETTTLTQAMQAMDRVTLKALFVLRDDRLVAAVTDGDMRRFIMRRGLIDARVSDFANYTPRYLHEADRSQAEIYMKRYDIRAIPIVDEQMHIVAIIERGGMAISVPTIDIPVVINAGGKGARLYPYTKILPKPLIPIGDVPIAELIINRFEQMGCNQFYMIVNHKKNMIKAYFNEVEKKGYTLNFIDEEVPLGTGGGLSLLKEKLNETFIFANCDTIIDDNFEKILRTHRENGNLITMIAALKHFDIPYGVVEIGENGCITGFNEKPHMSFLTNTGCYIVEPQVVKDMEKEEAIGFPTVIERYRSAGKPVGIYPVSEQAWLDMGQFESMEEMRIRLEK